MNDTACRQSCVSNSLTSGLIFLSWKILNGGALVVEVATDGVVVVDDEVDCIVVVEGPWGLTLL